MTTACNQPHQWRGILDALSPAVAPPSPNILYKYVTYEGAVAMLAYGTARFGRPTDFNDPYDLQWDPTWQVNDLEFIEMQVDALIRILTGPVDWDAIPDRVWRLELSRMRVRFDAEFGNMGIAKARQALIDRIRCSPAEPDGIDPVSEREWFAKASRVWCLTEIPDSLVMWSHYADHHKGCVLGFDTSKLNAAWKTRPLQAVYSRTLPRSMRQAAMEQFLLRQPLPGPTEEEVRSFFAGKADAWAYEKEWRYVFGPRDAGRSFTDVQIPRPALKVVMLGCRTDTAAKQQVRTLVGGWPQAELRTLVASRIQYELIEDDAESSHG